MAAISRGSARGRPSATSHAEIERVAFELFAEKGFSRTTMDDIASALGVGKRTLFRYYPSKNDIPWGQFGRTLSEFEALLRATPADVPLHEAVHRGVVAFNSFPAEVEPAHRERMRLILTTPELQAHSVLQYAAWRRVIAGFIADRTGGRATDLGPQVVGQVSLALALAAYESWLTADGGKLSDFIDEAMAALRWHLAVGEP